MLKFEVRVKDCHVCKELTTNDKNSNKWNVAEEGASPICFECDYKIFLQENGDYPEYGPEEIAEENEIIRRNNREYYDSQCQQERDENNYYEVETLPTLGLSLSSGGKRKIYY